MPLKSRDMIDASDPRVAQIGHPAPPWLINYADLMTELCCFFIILYALQAALQPAANQAASDVQKEIDEGKVTGDVKTTKEGLKISLEEKGNFSFFEIGKAELTPEAKQMIDKIVPEIIKLPNELVVEGHTDADPISTAQYSSNWELSTARATNVVKYLINEKQFPPNKLAAIGYGEFKPVAPNDTVENKKKNRRIVFFFKNMGSEKVIKEGGHKKGDEKKKKEAPAEEK
ncbi:MAG: hypothetical protein A2231_10300 [Candidatus Firestonebacteria bacterium RIFOXYA2_FULL_40_8]|nr:MAG: hypothetical protein A2231_10300 [Candidatus Firestonebacteria bacterium RIFOXYA2_FULL_40_8]